LACKDVCIGAKAVLEPPAPFAMDVAQDSFERLVFAIPSFRNRDTRPFGASTNACDVHSVWQKPCLAQTLRRLAVYRAGRLGAELSIRATRPLRPCEPRPVAPPRATSAQRRGQHCPVARVVTGVVHISSIARFRPQSAAAKLRAAEIRTSTLHSRQSAWHCSREASAARGRCGVAAARSGASTRECIRRATARAPGNAYPLLSLLKRSRAVNTRSPMIPSLHHRLTGALTALRPPAGHAVPTRRVLSARRVYM
jgi:hypothetical protein